MLASARLFTAFRVTVARSGNARDVTTVAGFFL